MRARAALLLVLAAPCLAAPERRIERRSELATDFPVAGHRVLDVDGDGTRELLVVGSAGEVRVWRAVPDADGTRRFPERPAGALVLSDPKRTLLATADVLGTGGPPQLVVLSRGGLSVHPVADGVYARAAIPLAPRARLALRTGAPRFADILRDVNSDGHPDLVVPQAEGAEIWLWTPPPARGTDGASDAPGTRGDALPEFRKAATVRLDVARARSVEHDALSDVLEGSLRIPALRIADVNGDGRADLSVEDGDRRAFHLAREDGSLPAESDVSVDLAIFEDTTPEAEVRLGRTLAGSDARRFESRDLDGDGIPDHVIAHRRKVWVFPGGPDGPQFTKPSQILQAADDVTAMLVLRLDEDPLPDLLLLRVAVPTVATLLQGLVASWDVDVAAAGYENAGGATFRKEAKWRGDLALRLPAILGVLRDPEPFVRRFEDVSKRFRRAAEGDFDGDGSLDVASPDAEERTLEVWFGRAGDPGADDAEAEIGRLFFADEDRTWDVDRVLRWLGAMADRHTARLTGGRASDARIALRSPEAAEFLGFETGDLDGVPGEEIVVAYGIEERRAVFEVWR